MANLQERLIKEEARLGAESNSNSALYWAKQGKNSAEKTKLKEKEHLKKCIECFKYKQKGHIARNCRTRRYGKEINKNESRDGRDCAFLVETRKDSTVPSVRLVRKLLTTDLSNVWLDSGALRHVTYRREWFSDLRATSDGDTISLEDNGVCKMREIGTIKVMCYAYGEWIENIEDVLYVPKLQKNLFSVGVCTSIGYEVKFSNDQVSIVQGIKTVAVDIKQENELYHMCFRMIAEKNSGKINVSTTSLKL